MRHARATGFFLAVIALNGALSEATKEEGRVRGTLGDGSGRIRVQANQGRIRLLPTGEK